MKIKALVMDVDGTLSDGGIYIGQKGEVMKRFSCKDGYAIVNILPKLDIVPIILTGRNSDIVRERCKELHITRVFQGSNNKMEDLKKILANEQILLEETAYIGDDLNDYDVMQIVGVRGCPADAVKGIKEICEFISSYNGGMGAVREFIEWLGEKGNNTTATEGWGTK